MIPLQVARSRPALIAALLGAAGLAWWWTVLRMSGMDAGPGTSLGTLGWFTGSWAPMMAAMMLPSFGPTLAAYVTLTPGRPHGRWMLFGCGYLLVWAAAGLLAYGVYELGKALVAQGDCKGARAELARFKALPGVKPEAAAQADAIAASCGASVK